LVQGYGRSIRSKDDWASMYILDGAFGYFVRIEKSCLTGFYRLSIKVGKLAIICRLVVPFPFWVYIESNTPTRSTRGI
jgi:hypothetical protein